MAMNVNKNESSAGRWIVGGDNGLNVYVDTKPWWLHRVMCKIVFGFVWKDV